MQKPKISVIVNCYNKKETIANCINSVLNQKFDSFELIVVDDGSTDGSDKIISKFLNDPRLKVYKIPHNGISAAKNQGTRMASGEIILFLDGDCELNQNSLTELYNSFTDPAVGCVGGELRATNYANPMAKTIELIQNEVERKWPFGANVAYRRIAFEQAGGFEERMEKGEDAELYLKVKKLGFKCVINPKVSAKTINPDSILKFFKQRFGWGTGFAQLTERHKETFTRSIKLCFITTALMIASLFLVIIDVRLAAIPLAIFIWSILRRIPLAVSIAKRTENRWHVLLIPPLQFLNAVAYFFGWIYWKTLELAKKRVKLEAFTPVQIQFAAYQRYPTN
jgi:glycosyltransferase involved in cell wall biosynthesis